MEQSPPQEDTLAPQPTRSAGSTSVKGQVAELLMGCGALLEAGPAHSQSTNSSGYVCSLGRGGWLLAGAAASLCPWTLPTASAEALL